MHRAPEEFGALIVDDLGALVVDSDRSTVNLVRSVLLGARRISSIGAANAEMAWELLTQPRLRLVVIAHAPPLLDAPRLTRELRRSDLASRKAPVVMLAPDPTQSQIKAARDSGVHEVLRKPFTLADLMLRIDTVLNKRRGWVEGIGYVGPDRRRFNSALLATHARRRFDKEKLSPENARIGQALKIMKAAIDAIDTDPRQALRALRAQAAELQDVAVAMADFGLASTAQRLSTYLDAAADKGRFNSTDCAAKLGGLLAAASPSREPPLRRSA
jgi:DNA-binding response OmpR family regulator